MDTKIRIVSEAAGDGFARTDADLQKLEAAQERLNALGAQSAATQAEVDEALAVGIKLKQLDLEVAERRAIVAGDEAALKEIRNTRQELQLMLNLSRQFNLTLDDALPIAKELAALERQADAAVAARVAERDLEVATMRAQAALNAQLVAEEGVRLAEERRITQEKEKQEALQLGMLKRAAGQVGGALGIGGIAGAAAGGIGGVAALVGVDVLLRVITGLMEKLGKASEETGDAMKETGRDATLIYDGLGRAIDRVKKPVDEFTAAQEAVKTAVQGVEERIKAAANEAERLRRAEDSLGDAKLASAIANVDLAEARGNVSPEEANAQRAGLRSSAAQAKLDREEAAARSTVRAAAAEVGAADAKYQKNLAEEKAARDAYAAAVRNQEKAKLEIEKAVAESDPERIGPDSRIKAAEAAKNAADEEAASQQRRVNRTHRALEASSAALKTAQEQLAESTKEAKKRLELIGIEKGTASTTAQADTLKEQNKATEAETKRITDEIRAGDQATYDQEKFQKEKADKLQRQQEKEDEAAQREAELLQKQQQREAEAAAKQAEKDAAEREKDVRQRAEERVSERQPNLGPRSRESAVQREIDRINSREQGGGDDKGSNEAAAAARGAGAAATSAAKSITTGNKQVETAMREISSNVSQITGTLQQIVSDQTAMKADILALKAQSKSGY